MSYGRGATLAQSIKERKRLRLGDKKEAIRQKEIPRDWQSFVSLMRIQSGAKIVSFQAYDYQIELDKCFDENHTTITIKSRQMGFTTYMASKAIQKAALNPAYTAIFISQTQNDASAIASLTRKMISSIPEYITAENDNLMVQRIQNGGTIHFRSPGHNATRGIPSVSDLFIDEAAFITDIELLYGVIKNTQSMVGEDARTLIVSTPNTLTDWYCNKLMGEDEQLILTTIERMRAGEIPPIETIVNKKTGWAKFICHWLAHPDYSKIPNFLEKCSERDGIPVSEVKRERDLSFDDNTDSVFSYTLMKGRFYSPTFPKEYIEGGIYYLGIDTAGQGTDYFVASVIEQYGFNQYRLVDMYRKQAGTVQQHLLEVFTLIDKYKPYTVSIEVNGIGHTFYELLATEKPSQSFNRINTNLASKAKMITKLLYLLEKEMLELVEYKPLVQEFLGFQRKGAQFITASGKHDDIVMSVAFTCDSIPLN